MDVPRPHRGREWGTGTSPVPLDLTAAPDADGSGGRRWRVLFSLSLCCNYRAYLRGEREMGNGVAAADGREGNPRKRGGTDATLYGGSSTSVPHGGLLLLSDAGRKASRGVNDVRRWKEGRGAGLSVGRGELGRQGGSPPKAPHKIK